MTRRPIARLAGAALLTAALAAGSVTVAADARADYEPGCVSQFWMYGLRGTTRTLCDGPVRADGSWMRIRQFYAPRRYVPMTCNWGSYGGSCYGGYWLEEFDKRDTYPVTPDTVLPDEPGHIAEGQLA